MKKIQARRIPFIFTIVLGIILIFPVSAQAGSLMDFFTLTYSVQFSKTDIGLDETFSVVVTGEVTCNEDLSFPYYLAEEAEITAQVIAQNVSGGAEVILNSGYTVNLTPFPKLAGEHAQDTKVVSLLFPSDSPGGSYTVTGKLINARVRAGSLWLDVTSNLPQSQSLGTIRYAMPPAIENVTLNIAVNGSGSTTPAPGLHSYLPGAQVRIEAVASPGWLFVGWDGDLESIANPVNITLDSDRSVTAVFASVNPVEYSLPLALGWNYISLPLIPLTNTVEDVLSSITGDYTEVWSYSTPNQEWKIYVPGAPVEFYDRIARLETMTTGEGYLIRMRHPAVLTGTGLEIQEGTYGQPCSAVYPGWNLIGFKTMDLNHDGQIEQSSDQMLAGYYLRTLDGNQNNRVMNDEVNNLRYYNPAGGFWDEIADIDNMIVGQGYWLNWHFPTEAVIQPPRY